MTNDQFFRGFLSALRLLNHWFIDTRCNRQHDCLRRVAEAVHSREDWPILIPSPFSGVYRELDEALLTPWLCIPRLPFGAEIIITAARAAAILREFEVADRDAIVEYARMFVESANAIPRG